jgi:hypothetical protein
VRAIETSESRSPIQDPDDKGLKGAGIEEVAAGRVGSGDAALAIGRAGQRNARARTGEHVSGFGGITHGINIGVSGLHASVDFDTTGECRSQARLFWPADRGANAYAKQDQSAGTNAPSSRATPSGRKHFASVLVTMAKPSPPTEFSRCIAIS